MKKLILFIYLLSCANILLFAQKQPSDTLLFQVDFAPKKISLSEEAQHTLKMLLSIAEDGSSYNIVIHGHTENVGDNTQNQSLAMQRCEMVKQHLLLLNAKPTALAGEYNIKPFDLGGENTLENRRIDIWVTVFHDEKPQPKPVPALPKEENLPASVPSPVLPQKEIILAPKEDILTEICQEMRAKKTQSFKFDSQIENHIDLKSGSVLYIPEKAFDLQDANNPTVEIRVEEYFKKSEMLIANLHTTSNGELLETAGMFYISAFSNGKKVELAPNKCLRINVLSQKDEYIGNTQTFQGITDASGNVVDWKDVTPYFANLVVKGLYCIYRTPDSISAKMTIKAEDVCLVSETGDILDLKSQKKEKLDKKQQAILEKYKVKSVDELELKFSRELEKANANNWIQLCMRDYVKYLSFYEPREREMNMSIAMALANVKLAWTNCDRYLRLSPDKLAQIKVEPCSAANTATFAVMREENIIVPINSQVPKNAKMYLVGIQKKSDEEYLLSITEERADELIKKWNWETVSFEELPQKLKKLDD